MSNWNFHFCFLNEETWPRLGCDVPKYHSNPVRRAELSTPWFHLSLALGQSGKFFKIRNYYSGMPVEEQIYDSKWWIFRRKQRRT